MRVESRVALITGGSSGIGAACVYRALARGWKVSVLALPDSDLDRLEGLDLLIIAGDITSERVRENAVERTLSRYKCVDVLINSAGVGLYAPPTEVSLPLFRRILEVNAIAPIALTQMLIPVMRKGAAVRS
jgi:NAD(P)-dependent dehydrogenase (short-subunit alcohol dehydrogenase family)